MERTKTIRMFSLLWLVIIPAALFLLLHALFLAQPGGLFGLKTAVARHLVKCFVPGIYYGAAEEDAGGPISLPALCAAQWQPLTGYVNGTKPLIPSAESEAASALPTSGQTEEAPSEAGQSPTPAANTAPDSQTPPAPAPETAANETAAALPAHSPVGTSYSAAQLENFSFLLNTFFTLDPTTTVNEELLNGSALLGKDLTLTQDNSQPQILIYHTHSQEEFADSTPGDPATGIVGVGNYLTKLLTETYGYNVIHDTSTYDLIDGELDRNKAYTLALNSISRILEENPSVQIIIDLHRDGINGDKMTSQVNGKETAKFMFFNGLSRTAKNGEISYLYNPYIQDNLAFSLQLQLKAALYYPGVTRPIYLKGYRYNLHLRPRSILVEAGSQKNTFQEELNAMDVLADILNMVLKGES